MQQQENVDRVIDALVEEIGDDKYVIGYFAVEQIPSSRLLEFFKERIRYYTEDDPTPERVKELREIVEVIKHRKY